MSWLPTSCDQLFWSHFSCSLKVVLGLHIWKENLRLKNHIMNVALHQLQHVIRPLTNLIVCGGNPWNHFPHFPEQRSFRPSTLSNTGGYSEWVENNEDTYICETCLFINKVSVCWCHPKMLHSMKMLTPPMTRFDSQYCRHLWMMLICCYNEFLW